MSYLPVKQFCHENEGTVREFEQLVFVSIVLITPQIMTQMAEGRIRLPLPPSLGEFNAVLEIHFQLCREFDAHLDLPKSKPRV